MPDAGKDKALRARRDVTAGYGESESCCGRRDASRRMNGETKINPADSLRHPPGLAFQRCNKGLTW